MFCTGKYERSSIKVNEDASKEYEQLKNHCLFSTIDRNAVSDNTFTIFECAIISKNMWTILSMTIYIWKNDVIGFIETPIES